MKRIKIIIALLLLTSISLAACDKSKSNKTLQNSKTPAVVNSSNAISDVETTGDYQTTYGSKVFDDVSITVEIFDRSNAPEGSTVINNKWIDYINREMGKVGINLSFVAVPRSEEVSSMQLMMASGTGPDIMLCYSSSIVEGCYKDGGIYNLAPYVDGQEQALNLKEYIGDECLNIARNSENDLWAIPARRSTTTASNIFIRKDWLDDLGLDIPTTVEEMYEVLLAFREYNPDGRNDVIASGFSTCKNLSDPPGLLSYAFLNSVLDETTFKINSGSATDLIYTDSGYGEYFKWINKLYNEGLMDPEYYVGNNQTMKEDFVKGKIGCFELNVNYNVDSLRGSLLKILQANDPDADVISIPPLKNIHDGNIYNNGYPIHGAFVFIPKTCKNVEAAITYLDWLSTEQGGFTLFHGIEGEHFSYDEEGIPRIIDDEYNSIDKDWIRHDLFLVGNQGYYRTEEEFEKTTAYEAPGYENYVVNNYKNASTGIIRSDSTFTSPTYMERNTEISIIRNQYFIQLVTCDPEDYDRLLQEFKEKLKGVGYDQIILERSEFYR